MKTFGWSGLVVLMALGGCADFGASSDEDDDEGGTSIDVPGTAIENRSTLAYAVGQLRVYINQKYGCSEVNIVNARRLTAAGNKSEFAEEWEADVCGTSKHFDMNFVNDMTGGAVLTIRE